VTGLALVIHELATNAAKYGAITTEAGHVDISWHRDADNLLVSWAESDGPSIAAPAHSGFGSKLVQSTVVGQFKGVVDYAWRSSGLVVKIAIPLDGLK
jgi:two-component sensor histidine kinase